jgi:hypothetical protein
MTAWDQLDQLVTREHELVAAESWHELLGVQAERERLFAALPSPPPADARDLLVAARSQCHATVTALQRAMTETGQRLDALRRGRAAVRAYGAGERSGLEARA